jgi:heme A synthase
MLFMLTEAGVGALLVLFRLVADNASIARALFMSIHLTNTFLLLGSLALTGHWLSGGTSVGLRGRGGRAGRAIVGAVALVATGVSGAVAALGDTLFPATSLREGLAQDLSPVAHVFLRLRLLHPVIALGSGVVVLGAAGLVRSISTSARARGFGRLVTMLFVLQFAAGLLNLSLLAPIGMQLVHLLLADATWIALVLMAWESWGARARVPAPAPSQAAVA